MPQGASAAITFTGVSSPETAQGKRYSAADVLIREYRRLDRLILQHGFPHHLAVAMSDISREVAEVCAVLDIEYFNPAETA